MVKHVIEKDLLEMQAEAERQMLEEFEAGDYSLENPLVKLNPYYISPCAAVILFRTEKETAVTVTVRGKESAADIVHTFPKGKTHILPVLGLHPDFCNTVDISIYQGRANTVSINTEPSRKGVVEIIGMNTSAKYLGKDLIILTEAATGFPTGFDYKGDVRWYISIDLQMDLKRLKNGRLLVGTHRMVGFPYYSTGTYELDMVGKIYKEYRLPGAYHHDQWEMPDGDILVLTEDYNSPTVEDVCVLLDRNTGEVKKTWDFKDIITPGDGSSGLRKADDWFHNNSVCYDANTNSLLLSGRHIDAIVNIDFDTGKINWILGDPTGWSEEKQKYFFTPVGANFQWQYAQHAALVTPNGDIMCFDNGTLRSKIKENYLKNKDNYSRAVRYRINTEQMTVEQVWQYKLREGCFSQHISNVKYYGEGHYMVHSGGIQFYDGVVSETLISSTSSDPLIRRESATFELLDDEIMLELRVKGNSYRGEKLPLYYEGANLELSTAVKVGNLAVTKKSDTDFAETSPEKFPEDIEAYIVEESDRFSLKARFENGAKVMLLLEQNGSVSGYDVKTDVNTFAKIFSAPYLEQDARNVCKYVNKSGLSGEYGILLMVEEKVYDTGVKISC